jgi:flagellar hook assembly protein FlgD
VKVQLRLGDIIPEKSALLQNYPNPFNPETWIPFHLKSEASVSIRIFNLSGQLVKTLDLGNMDAGVYVSRTKAAYWDGKNEAGEEVSSGIYFYTLQAGDFNSTKKMVVRR